MVGWYILIGIILFIALILIIPVGVDVGFEDDLWAKLKIGFVSITLYPPKPEKPKKEKKKKKKEKKKEEKEEEPEEKKTNLIKEKGIGWLIEFIRQAAIIARGVLRDFFKHLKIKTLNISITYAGTDADDTAVKYGYFCLSVYPAVSILTSISKCKNYGVDIAPDFTVGHESFYSADISLRIRIVWIVALVFKHGFKALKLLWSLRRGKNSDLEKYLSENDPDYNKGDNDMEHPIGNLMNVTMDKIKEMIDVNTIVGEPITSADGTLIIPVSKVSYGFASGGSDLPTNFSEHCDGYESAINYSDIKNLTLDQLNNVEQSDVPDNTAGKVVGNVKWYIACEVSQDEAQDLTIWDSNVTVLLTEACTEAIPAEIFKISQTGDGKALVVLQCDYMNEGILQARKEPIEIGLGTYTGLRVSKRAIHDDYVTKTTYDDNDNSHKEQKKVQGVYVLYGSEVQFKQVSIIYADEDYVICDTDPPEGVLFNGETISLYDKVIVKGDDLHDGKVIS